MSFNRPPAPSGTGPWKNIYRRPRFFRKKKSRIPTPLEQKYRAARKQVERLENQIEGLKKQNRALREESKHNPIYKGYRQHIADLHAKIERLKDPSIPRRARKDIRKAVSRIDEIPNLRLYAAEKVFVQDAIDRGYLVYRSGWPDFLLIHKQTGERRFIEVKSPTDDLTDSQRAMFAALEQCGIEIEIYRAGKQPGTRCSPWRDLQEPDSGPPEREVAAMSNRGGDETKAVCSACEPKAGQKGV